MSERGGGQRERRRIAQGLALLGTVLVLVLFGGVGGASAHAALTGTDPQDGSVLKTAPTEVTLTFSESIGLLDDSFRVLTPENRRVHTGDPGHAGDRSDTARVTLPKGLGTGTFTVAWRVVSADSHPISGAFTFSIGKPSATAPPVPVDPDGNTAAGTLYDAARYFAYGGLALLIGAATFVLVCGFPGPVRRLLLTGWWILAGSTVALLLLRGPYERGSGPADAFDPSVLSETLTSRPGLALVARLVLLGAAVFYPVREQARGRVVLALGGLLTVSLAVTWAVAEHASAGIQVPVAMVSSVLHLLSMAVWLGGLGALLTALYRSAEPLPAAVVNRFSRLALASVTVLVVTGVYQSWRGLGSWDALTSTSYGRLLLAKLVAVLVLLAGAGASRRWTGRLMLAAEEERAAATVRVERRVPETVGALAAPTGVRTADVRAEGAGGAPDDDAPDDHTPDEDAPDEDAPDPDRGPSDKTTDKTSAKTSGKASDEADRYRRALRRSVLVEVVVGVVVLVITTLLTGTQPGRAATEAAAASATEAAGQATASTTTIPFDVGTKGGHGEVQIQLTPSRVGENSVQAVIYGPDGGFATVPELRLTFTLESQQIGPIDAELTDKGGYWAADGVTLPVAGTWTMKATVRTTDIDQVTVSKTVKIG
ncbi:copper resistance CopC/CopD family protein [Streptomyces sp. NBC_01483]|uniref:copper resistance CopC/CopD family protein n=1 Tax=Streptomyces sp. NBC_01483 TaxID=2903883 RepID=UPI002E33ED0D|nr:copper resistance protein CopC [Streptomyces sp. NBC_01483]